MNETNLADLFAEEPPDGTHLVMWAGGDPEVIWRNDAAAKRWDGQPGEYWFHDRDCDPMCLTNILHDASQVHAVVPLGQSGLTLTEMEG